MVRWWRDWQKPW